MEMSFSARKCQFTHLLMTTERFLRLGVRERAVSHRVTPNVVGLVTAIFGYNCCAAGNTVDPLITLS